MQTMALLALWGLHLVPVWSAIIPKSHQQDLAVQQQHVLGNEAEKLYAVPIDFNGFVNTINITIGTPPQHFNMSLDLIFNGFVVPSDTCEKYWCDYLPKQNYSSSDSSTFKPNGTWKTTISGDQEYRGPLSYDTVRFGDLAIEHQTFIEYRFTRMRGWGSINWGFDGVIGLAPSWNNGSTDSQEDYYPNYLRLLKEKDELAENVMSLTLPRKPGEQGELMLGGTNSDLYTGDFKTVELVQDDGRGYPPIDLFYSTPITSITLNTSKPHREILSSKTKAILSTEPYMILPENFTRTMLLAIGASRLDYLRYHVPCSTRAYLPELVFEIGAHNLSISAWDYVVELEPPMHGMGTICVVWITPDDEEWVMLGGPFLKAFYTRFDLDRKEVGFAEVKR
ncbi:acid protease [Polyplosphaeria fusca]|uniref:Acid protease n=1 Tax=Polyplosphaeria fusca TaxID=682080 RepID=A0A9P4UZI3_9PLEO|nr:acid protease [Polyplosphaeria fusca]